MASLLLPPRVAEHTKCLNSIRSQCDLPASGSHAAPVLVAGKPSACSAKLTVAPKPSHRVVRALAEAREVVVSDKAPDVKLLDVEVESEVGQSYDVLQQQLARGNWEGADQETRRLLCVLAGEGAAKRKWVYFTEAQYIPQKDLRTIDRLWRAYSEDKFGYSVQRRIWKALDQQWKPFFLKIEWTYGERSTYKKFPMEYSWSADAPKGHLPLTNCLRGTQLLYNILLHPAFDEFDDEQFTPDDAKLPDFIKKDPEATSTDNGSATPASPPRGLTGSIFDEDFNSADFGF